MTELAKEPEKADESGASQTWIWVFDGLSGLQWVIRHQAMAFPESAPRRTTTIRQGDRAIIYLTRSGSIPSRIVGRATVLDAVIHKQPITIEGIVGRRFGWFCPIRLDLLPLGRVLDVRPLLKQLSFIRRQDIWGQFFRGSPILISEQDFGILDHALTSAGELDRPGQTP